MIAASSHMRPLRVVLVIFIWLATTQTCTAVSLIKHLYDAGQQCERDGITVVLSQMRSRYSSVTKDQARIVDQAAQAILLCSYARFLEPRCGGQICPEDTQAVIEASGYPGDADGACRAAIRATFGQKRRKATCAAYLPQLQGWFDKLSFVLTHGEMVAVDEIVKVCGAITETEAWMYLCAITRLFEWRQRGASPDPETYRFVLSLGNRLSQLPSRTSVEKGHFVLGLAALLENRFDGSWLSTAISHWRKYRPLTRGLPDGIVKHLYCTLANAVVVVGPYDGSIDPLDMIRFVGDYKDATCHNLDGPPDLQLDRIHLGIALIERDVDKARKLLSRPGVAASPPASTFDDLETHLLFGQFVQAVIDATDGTIASDPRMVDIRAALVVSNVAKNLLANSTDSITAQILIAVLLTNPQLFIDDNNMPTRMSNILDSVFRDGNFVFDTLVTHLAVHERIAGDPRYAKSPFSTLANALDDCIELPYDDDDGSPIKQPLHLEILAGHILVAIVSLAPSSVGFDDLLAVSMIGCTTAGPVNLLDKYVSLVCENAPPQVSSGVALLRNLVHMLYLRPGWWTESRLSPSVPPPAVKKRLDALYAHLERHSDDLRVQLLVAYACRITAGVAPDLDNLCSRKLWSRSKVPVIKMSTLRGGYPPSFRMVHRLLSYMEGEITGKLVTTDMLFAVDNYLAAGLESRLAQEDVYDLVIATYGASPLAIGMLKQADASEETVYLAGLVVTYIHGEAHPSLRSEEVLDVYDSLLQSNSTFGDQCRRLRELWFPESSSRPDTGSSTPSSEPRLLPAPDVPRQTSESECFAICPSTIARSCPPDVTRYDHPVRRRRASAPEVSVPGPVSVSKRRMSANTQTRSSVASKCGDGASTDEGHGVITGCTLKAFVHAALDANVIAEIRSFVQDRPSLLDVRGPFTFGAKMVASSRDVGRPLWRLRHGRKRLFFVVQEGRMKFTGVIQRDRKTYGRMNLDAQVRIAQSPEEQWVSLNAT